MVNTDDIQDMQQSAKLFSTIPPFLSVIRHIPVLFFVFLIITNFTLNLSAEEFWYPDASWGANLPEAWSLMSMDEQAGICNFADPRGHAIFQVFAVKGSGIEFAASLAAKMSAIEADAGTSDFTYDGHRSKLTDYKWKAGSVPVRGYIMGIDPKTTAAVNNVPVLGYVVACYSFVEEWETYHDFLLSAIDSFFIGESAIYLPGPLSQLIAADGWSGGPVSKQESQVDAAQSVAEREARVLYSYVKAKEEVQRKAWRRFYQLIYRDNFERIHDVADRIGGVFTNEKTPKERIPVALLAWIQSFTYEETGSLSDLRVPVDAVIRKLGDCDARGLVYLILLEHLGCSGILMISPVYQHAMVGVGMEGSGFYFTCNDKNWLVAETTVKVPIGQIRSDMNEPKNWMGFDLHFTP